MAWNVELSAQAAQDLEKIDATQSRRILRFLYDRVAPLDDPRSIGQALKGSRFEDLWRYRVGDYRIVCQIRDVRVLVLVLRVGHRREIYR